MRYILRNVTRVALLMVAVQTASSVGVAAAIDLNWKFHEGESFNYITTQEMATTIRVSGQTLKLVQTQQVDMRWIVEKVNEDDSANIRQKIERVRLKISNGQGPALEVDSQDQTEPTDPGGQILWKLVRTLAKTEVSMTMDAKGVISDATVPDEVGEAIASIQLPENMKQMFGEEGLKEMTQRSGLRLPKGPIEKGSTWNDKKAAAGVKINKTYEYDGKAEVAGRPLEKIKVTAEVELIPDPKAPAKLEIVAQKMDGVVYFDADAGHLSESTLSQDMQMKAEAEGQSFEQRIRQVEVTKIRRDDDTTDAETAGSEGDESSP